MLEGRAEKQEWDGVTRYSCKRWPPVRCISTDHAGICLSLAASFVEPSWSYLRALTPSQCIREECGSLTGKSLSLTGRKSSTLPWKHSRGRTIGCHSLVMLSFHSESMTVSKPGWSKMRIDGGCLTAMTINTHITKGKWVLLEHLLCFLMISTDVIITGNSIPRYHRARVLFYQFVSTVEKLCLESQLD